LPRLGAEAHPARAQPPHPDLRFFTQADVEVQDCYHDKYGSVFKPTEIKMMLTAFSNMETVHIAAYSHLLDTIGMPESEYSAFLQYKEMKDKHDYLGTFGVDTDADIAKTLAMFGAFTEGLQLFASFAMLMNFPRFNKMKGMGQIVSWSVRDESLHCEGIIKLFHAFVKERDCLTADVKEAIIDQCQKTVRLEDAFIDLAFEQGPVEGMTPSRSRSTSATSPTGASASSASSPSTWSTNTPSPGSPRC
jgi:ribonucleoside-diphosphate reductase beta chain